jgi:Flp pilus assembly protein TadG
MCKSERLLDTFVRDRRGATAVIFGIAAVPFLLAAGVAVEYSALNRAQAELQALSDAAALAAAGAHAPTPI